jgi:Zn-dependent peptidase ImmA (M78 family)
MALRDFAGLRRDDDRLNPFDLARFAKLQVVSFTDLEERLSAETVQHLVGAGKDKWSGGACSRALPNGKKIIILNPTQGKNRQNATLMEEICHVFLGHQPSRLDVKTVNKKGDEIARDYRPDIEEEAYSVGAAALVPFSALARMVEQGKTSREIARHFNVSRELVEYRLKISRLWPDYKQNMLIGGTR